MTPAMNALDNAGTVQTDANTANAAPIAHDNCWMVGNPQPTYDK